MENDGFLEFKWKGDQFLIFFFMRHLHWLILGFCRRSAFQMDNEGRQVSLKWKKGGRASHLCCGKLDNNSGRGRIFFAFCFRDQIERSLGREQLFCYSFLTLIITTDMSSIWIIPDDNQIFCLWVLWSRDVSTNILTKTNSLSLKLKIPIKVLCWELAGGLGIKKAAFQSDGIVTLSMHPSMLTPRCRQTEGMARLDNQVRVC